MSEDNSQLINTLMGMLGDNPQEKINAVLNSLTNNSAPDNTFESEQTDNDSSPVNDIPDLSALSKMQGLLSQMGNTNDERTRLLASLKPFLSDTRKPHVDRALQLLKLTRLAQLAKDMDLFKDLKL